MPSPKKQNKVPAALIRENMVFIKISNIIEERIKENESVNTKTVLPSLSHGLLLTFTG